MRRPDSRFQVMLFGLLVVVPARAFAADPGWGHHRSYAGQWAGSAEFKQIRATVERERIAALGSISRSLGIEMRGDRRADAIVFEYVDKDEAASLGFPSTSRGGFRPPLAADATERVITVIVDRFLQSRDELPGFICHEMIHAAMSLLMGPKFASLAPWVQEGLAVYGAGQGTEKLARLVAASPRERAGFPDGLDIQSDRLADYVEAYLAIAFIAELRGQQAVRAFTGDVVRNLPVEQAIQDAARLTPTQFGSQAADYARHRVEAMVSPPAPAPPSSSTAP